jgi:transcription-repair coupling factor (superfamily II helicase)
MLLDIFRNAPLYLDLIGLLKTKKKLRISGLTDTALSVLLNTFVQDNSSSPLLFIVEKEKDIRIWQEHFLSVSSTVPAVFPFNYSALQLETISKIVKKEVSVLLCSLSSLEEKIIAPEIYSERVFVIKEGEEDYEALIDHVENASYFRTDLVAEPGEFVRRGQVIDIWPPGSENPYRIFFSDRTVSSIKIFDPYKQRTGKSCSMIEINPAGYEGDRLSTLRDYLPANTIAVFPDGYDDAADAFKYSMVRSDILSPDIRFRTRDFSFYDSLSSFKIELKRFREGGYRLLLTASTERELDRISDIIYGRPYNRSRDRDSFISLIRSGFSDEDRKTVLLTLSDILPQYRHPIYDKPKAHPISDISMFSEGSFVVHRNFGIGIFRGINTLKHGDYMSDFLKIEYKGGSAVYVAVENSDFVHNYSGPESALKPDSITKKSWIKRAEKVRKSVAELSKNLVRAYKDGLSKGFSFRPDDEMETQFNAAFTYQLTEDQRKSIEEVLKDMESDQAMDRLVCGDVGYGKTEVAARAAFRAVLNGKQVAILAPTTVLAKQHFDTFRRRFRNFPVRIELISRLVSRQEQLSIEQDLNQGLVDILIGTHKLFSDHLIFPALGLLIIDEEQRFGVEQKEKLRFKYPGVDIMATTATPIPRTLAMAMGKVKGFSLINTPPPGRIAIDTIVSPYSFELVRTAVLNEISRGGQCFYVHSRVNTLGAVVENLKKSFPDFSFASVHGRMKSHTIAKVMEDFVIGKIDCLVSTTIIENGLDIANVNTMIIDSAQIYGLSDIYQLRGRIGRSSIKAYCYLLYPDYLKLTGAMKERMAALQNFSYGGGGFQLALRDLQIRGAGAMLGAEQHGNIMKVGFEYYNTILEEEMMSIRGKEYAPPVEIEISVPADALIPEDYMNSQQLRLSYYRRISSINSADEIAALEKEMEDRFGRLPDETRNLMKVIRLKLRASKAGISSVAVSGEKVLFSYISGEKIEFDINGDIFKSVDNLLKQLGTRTD